MPATTAAQRTLKAAQGDPSVAYWELVGRYQTMLIGQAVMITGNRADAEDVVQETFCEAIEDQAQLIQVQSLGAWLRTLNRARALKRVRHVRCDRRHARQRANQRPRRMVTTGGFSMLETREFIAELIETLPKQMKTVLCLRHFDHLSYEQIAKELDVSQGSVGRLLFEATLRLRERVQRESDVLA